MREITTHITEGLNGAITIHAIDEPGDGGANHRYAVRVTRDREKSIHIDTVIAFQEGPVHEAGFNGLSNESLLAIVVDRLEGFQRGDYACRENAVALTNIQQALMWLKKRTDDRAARGVEGTSEQ